VHTDFEGSVFSSQSRKKKDKRIVVRISDKLSVVLTPVQTIMSYLELYNDLMVQIPS
jgi:hypothetical protein